MLLLKSLKILNIRRFKQETIHFNDGIIVVSGKNWAWKSTITDLIALSFFGIKWNDNFIRLKDSKSLINHTEDKQKPSMFQLEFEFNNESYTITRVINKGIKKHQSDFITEDKDKLVWPDGLEILGWVKVTEELELLLWITKHVFTNSVFTKQNEVSILGWKSNDRKDLINQILWINKVEVLASEYNSLFNDANKTLKVLKEQIGNIDIEEIKYQYKITRKQEKHYKRILRRKENLYKRVKLQKDTHDFYVQKININDTKKTSLSGNIKRYTEELEKLKKISTEYEEKKKDDKYKDIFDRETGLKEDKLKQDELKGKYERKQTYLKEIEINNENIASAEKQIQSILTQNKEPTYDTLKTKIEVLDRDIEKYDKELKEFDSKITAIQTKMAIIKKAWKELREEKNEFEWLKWKAHCPTCEQELWAHLTKVLARFDEKINAKIKEWQKETDNEKDLQEKRLPLSNKKDVLEKARKELDNSMRNIDRYKVSIETNKKSVDGYRENIEKIWDIKFNQEQYDLLIKDMKEVSIKTNELRQMEGEIKGISKLEQTIQESKESVLLLERDYKILSEKLNKVWFDVDTYTLEKRGYEQEKVRISPILDSISRSIGSYENDIKNYQEREEEIKKNERVVEIIGLKKNILQDYGKYLFRYLKPKIEEIASSYFSTATNHKYAKISIE